MRPNQFVHVGLLYRDQEDEIRLSHLAWHCHFMGKDTPDDSYFWLEPQLHEFIREQIAVYLQHIADQNEAGDIPYSILYRAQSIDESGKYVPSGPGTGLTCATYLMAVFDALQIPLVEWPTWPAGRPEDQEWAQQILALLPCIQPPASDEHVEAQRAHINDVVRYRPEEVAAAFGMVTTRAMSFREIEPTSLEIKAQLPTPPELGKS